MSFCSQKKKPVNNDSRAEKQILITQTVQLFLVFLFVVLLYEQEKIVLREITSNYAPWLIDQLKENLLSVKKIYQPAEFWRFLWPFLCVSVFMLLPQKIRWYFLGITGIISSVYLVANRIYDAFFTSVISLYSFKALPFVWSVKGSVAASLTIKESQSASPEDMTWTNTEEEISTEGDMVKCSQCGLHILRNEAVSIGDKYFCSDEHRQQYQSSNEKKETE